MELGVLEFILPVKIIYYMNEIEIFNHPSILLDSWVTSEVNRETLSVVPEISEKEIYCEEEESTSEEEVITDPIEDIIASATEEVVISEPLVNAAGEEVAAPAINVSAEGTPEALYTSVNITEETPATVVVGYTEDQELVSLGGTPEVVFTASEDLVIKGK